MPNCSHLQKSLNWCMGAPELPGIRRRIYYISKGEIALWPRYSRDANRRTKTSVLLGSFTLVADAKWKYIDILAEKSQLTSEAQGEMPCQTQLNKLTVIHPGVGPEATAAACYLNNSDNVFIVEDMKGLFRVVGSDKWMTKTTVTQDNGQGPTGTTSTTINVEATDEVPAPFYVGIIETEDGNIDCSEAYEGTDIIDTGGNTGGSGSTGGNTGNNTGNNSGNNSGNNTGNNTGNNSGNSGYVVPVYSNSVTINGTSYNVASGSVSITGPLTSLRFTGSNMDSIFVCYGNNNEDEAEMASNKASATWNDNVAGPATVRVKHWNGDPEDPQEISWFTINVTAASSGSNTGGNTGGDSNTIVINGVSHNATYGEAYIYEDLTSIQVNGTNMRYLSLRYYESEIGELQVSADGTVATWSGRIHYSNVVYVYRGDSAANATQWYKIYVRDPDYADE